MPPGAARDSRVSNPKLGSLLPMDTWAYLVGPAVVSSIQTLSFKGAWVQPGIPSPTSRSPPFALMGTTHQATKGTGAQEHRFASLPGKSSSSSTSP